MRCRQNGKAGRNRVPYQDVHLHRRSNVRFSHNGLLGDHMSSRMTPKAQSLHSLASRRSGVRFRLCPLDHLVHKDVVDILTVLQLDLVVSTALLYEAQLAIQGDCPWIVGAHRQGDLLHFWVVTGPFEQSLN